MENLKIYESIAERSAGSLMLGVVGPARVGKSTFIKRFMDLLVLPNVDDEYERARITDEMPQAGSGRTITTTEPKFVPAQAVELNLPGGMNCRVRLVDCVGYLVPDALGHMEDGQMRMVDTPWEEGKISFEQAAELGTRRVIEEHSTIGIVVTTDGSTSDIPRDNYIEAEGRVIRELQALGKPFVVLVNSRDPQGPAAQELAGQLCEKCGAAVMAVDCARMEGEQLTEIIRKVLYQFPVSRISFELPGFMEGLQPDHWLKREVISVITQWASNIVTAADLETELGALCSGENVVSVEIREMDLGSGEAVLNMEMAEGMFYRIMGELMGQEIENDAHFYKLISEFAEAKKSYDKVRDAMEQVEATEYGIVQPKLEEMILGEPELFHQGDKYGVRITAKAPSLHIIRTDITTEVSPVVGGQEHAEELLAKLLSQYESEPEKIWETNIFGKTVYEMTAEQMQSKLAGVPDNIRIKVQKSLQKISDEGKEYFICIIV